MINQRRLLTLGTIRDHILEYYPEVLWWDGFHKHETWNNERSYKHRQGMPNEIRIEFDSENKSNNWVNINLTAVNLWNRGYSFAIFYVEGGRSPHIHIYDLDELETLSYDNRTKYREKFLSKICPLNSNPDKALCEEKHLCALEFANHFKYNKPKQLLSYFWNGRNMGIDFDIKFNVLGETGKNKKTNDEKNKKLKFGNKIKQDARSLIIENLNFETVFDKYKIQYKGHMALCPFHADGDNSLSFSNEKGLWKCFGCNAKGDIISLIKMLREKDGNKSRS